MKKNFVVAVTTRQAYDALMRYAEANGYYWHGTKTALNNKAGFTYNEKTHITFLAGNKTLQYGTDFGYRSEHGPIITFDVFATIQGIDLGPEPMTMRLTDKYEAVIDYTAETVTVGCQVIPFTKVNEIHAGTKKHQKQKEVKGSLTEQQAINIVHEAFSDLCSCGQWDVVLKEYVQQHGALHLIENVGKKLHKNLHV